MIIDTRAVKEKLRQLEFDCEHEIDLYDTHGHIDDGFEELEDNMVNWCKENVKGRSMYDGDLKFLFQLEEEALAFKLAWS